MKKAGSTRGWTFAPVEKRSTTIKILGPGLSKADSDYAVRMVITAAIGFE